MIIFKIKTSLEIGLKCDKTVGSRLGFLIIGWTTACFKHSGIVPMTRHLLTMDSIGPSVASTSYNRYVGILSWWEAVGFKVLIMLFRIFGVVNRF